MSKKAIIYSTKKYNAEKAQKKNQKIIDKFSNNGNEFKVNASCFSISQT